MRRCLTYEEHQEAQQLDRVLRARRVLVWKPVPEEDRAQAKVDRLANPDTTRSTMRTSPAKRGQNSSSWLPAPRPQRWFLGHHGPSFDTANVRHLSLTVIAQRDWKLESLDLKTAFLQTGVRILRNVYGNADAPRELWRDVDTKLKSIGAHRLTDRGQLFLDLGGRESHSDQRNGPIPLDCFCRRPRRRLHESWRPEQRHLAQDSQEHRRALCLGFKEGGKLPLHWPQCGSGQ